MYKIYLSEKLNTKDLFNYVINTYNIKQKLCYNKYGKPYFENNDFYFNLSNSSNYSVMVLSDKEVGIDIQKIVLKNNLINKICNKNEIKLIKTKEDFTKIWTKKEAYVKCLGVGLSYGLKNVDTTKLNIKVIRYKDAFISVCL